MLAKHDKLEEVRLLHIPGITDFELEIDALAHFLGSLPQRTSDKAQCVPASRRCRGGISNGRHAVKKQIESLANASWPKRHRHSLSRSPLDNFY